MTSPEIPFALKFFFFPRKPSSSVRDTLQPTGITNPPGDLRRAHPRSPDFQPGLAVNLLLNELQMHLRAPIIKLPHQCTSPRRPTLVFKLNNSCSFVIEALVVTPPELTRGTFCHALTEYAETREAPTSM